MGGRRGGRSLGASLPGAAVGLLATCSGGWEVRTVTDVGQALSLDVASCNASYNVAVEEEADEVRVTVEQVDAGDVGAECADEVRVVLDAPVGDREVFVNGDRREVGVALRRSDARTPLSAENRIGG